MTNIASISGRLLLFYALFTCFYHSGRSQGHASQEPVQQSDTVYENPVIPGAFPDPTIIRVGDRYIAAGTSFDFAPCYPVYESGDLVNWELVSHIFPDPPAWAAKNFWAPELFYRDSTYFVYYTAKRRSDGVSCIGVASTPDIREGFTDHGIIIEWGREAIDAYVFEDGDGTCYITWKAYGLTRGRPIEILACELSDDGLRPEGEPFTLTDHSRGWKGGNDEGQILMKQGGYYYLFYSDGGCCDRHCDYRIRVARSRELREGWEQRPDPILRGGETWVCPGHGTIVTTPGGRFYYLYHAYHHTDFEYIGRQGMLGELVFNEDTGWPEFVEGNTPTQSAPFPYPGTVQQRDTVRNDYFNAEEALKKREWDLHYPRPSGELKDSMLFLTGNREEHNFLGFRPKTGNYTFSVTLPLQQYQQGIGIYSRRDKLLMYSASRENIRVLRLEDGQKKVLATVPLEGQSEISLKYRLTDGKYLRFYWSEGPGHTWNYLDMAANDTYDAGFLATWGFSPRAGLLWNSDQQTAAYHSIVVTYRYRQ